MPDPFSRAELLLGREGIARLAGARVILFGVGGVGSFTAEALGRSGIGTIELCDSDTVSETNLNRQLVALHSTIGQSKVEIMRRRLLDINPECAVSCHEVFFSAETAPGFDFAKYDYVLDAIDTVSAKVLLAELCHTAGTPLISCMGAGNKLDPTAFAVGDIYETSGCPLARVMRHELRRRGIPALKVVYSKEPPHAPKIDAEQTAAHRPVPGSVAFVPSVAGLIMAGEVVKYIAGAADSERQASRDR